MMDGNEGAYKDVTYSKNKKVVAAWKELEEIMKTLPKPDYNDLELKGQ